MTAEIVENKKNPGLLYPLYRMNEWCLPVQSRVTKIVITPSIIMMGKKHQTGKNTPSTFLVLARVLVGLPYLKEQDRCRVPFAPKSADT